MTTASVSPAASKLEELNTVQMSKRKCGFRNTGSHHRCLGGTRSGRKGVRICPCDEGERCGHTRCLDCNNTRRDEIDLKTWLCVARSECESRIRARLEADPLHQQVQQIKEKSKVTTTEEKTARAPKVAKTGTCLVTGKETKGGLFAPGMDAKYVSLKVQEVAEARFTKKAEDAALKAMKADGVSEKLQAKFTKAVGLAKERAAKQAKAKAAKPTKADTKVVAKQAAADVDDED